MCIVLDKISATRTMSGHSTQLEGSVSRTFLMLIPSVIQKIDSIFYRDGTFYAFYIPLVLVLLMSTYFR